MKILALETTERIGTVAAMLDDALLGELNLPAAQRSAQSLAPAMHDLFVQVGWKPAEVNLVAVSVGPGSFTGLRIGLTTAKMFAYCVGAEILGIDTLETIAAGAPRDVLELSAVIDAQRGELVERRFRRETTGELAPVAPQRLVDLETWLNELPPGISVTGPVLDRLIERIPPQIRVLEPENRIPRAATVARLALRDWRLGRRDDLWKIGPRYSRLSAAEEKKLRG